jgi:hypothetical protein
MRRLRYPQDSILVRMVIVKSISIAASLLVLVAACSQSIGRSVLKGASGAEETNEQAVAHHLESRLKDARQLYAKVLKLDPPREPTDEELVRVKRYAPLLYTTPTEPLPLKDMVVIVHPQQPIIAYHLFWEDDIDYPDDSEPCDHEAVWVSYDPESDQVTGVYTWYHSHLVTSQAAVDAANQRQGRPVVYVEWGKHGSLLDGWQDMRVDGVSIIRKMRRTHERLQTQGHRLVDRPLARNWPRRFEGSWEGFVDFSHLVDPIEWIEGRRMIMVSRWGNAVINQHFLLYNFHPKWEWPDLP